MQSFEEGLFESLTVNEKIEVQRLVIDFVAAEIRITEDHFWGEVAILVDSIRDLTGEMEDRLMAFQNGVLAVQKDCQEKIKGSSVECYRKAVREVFAKSKGKPPSIPHDTDPSGTIH